MNQTNGMRKRYQKDNSSADDILTLIRLVRQNSALYNYKLSPKQRRRSDVMSGWMKIAEQMGNKYTVEECRRKWKNLRDTYHQYRLRKPKLMDSLSKWRYAKALDFLSNVYQPKLKVNRQQMNTNAQYVCLWPESNAYEHNKHLTLGDDDAETFILAAYNESKHDDVSHNSNDHTMSQMDEFTHDDDVENVVEVVKNEHASSLDDDGANRVEVDYEEVCFYEESGNLHNDESENIIGNATSKTFQLIDSKDFCIGPINTHVKLSSGSSVIDAKLKNVTLMSNATATVPTMADTTTHSPQSSTSGQIREELDLFFDFLKKKMQRLESADLTMVQVEFLNVVQRYETELAQRNYASTP